MPKHRFVLSKEQLKENQKRSAAILANKMREQRDAIKFFKMAQAVTEIANTKRTKL